jgi:hypothetical protein
MLDLNKALKVLRAERHRKAQEVAEAERMKEAKIEEIQESLSKFSHDGEKIFAIHRRDNGVVLDAKKAGHLRIELSSDKSFRIWINKRVDFLGNMSGEVHEADLEGDDELGRQIVKWYEDLPIIID